MATIKEQAIRQSAFDEFKKIAANETANGAATLAYSRLVPIFSTASPAETKIYVKSLIPYWSRNGHSEWLIEAGDELYHWARDNGYSRSIP